MLSFSTGHCAKIPTQPLKNAFLTLAPKHKSLARNRKTWMGCSGSNDLAGKCDGLQEASTRHYPRAHRSKQCVTAIDIPAMAQSSVARSVTANSALSGTIAGEPRSAQGSARTASRRVARPTEVGYVSCTPPAESRSGAHQRAISRSSDSWVKETAQ
jgi:hypothetical protein